MKKAIYILLLLSINFSFSQNTDQRIEKIKNQLEILSVESSGLNDIVKNETNVTNITLSNFLLAIAQLNKLNINVSPDLSQITLANNFPDVKASDLLVFLCKEFDLTIDFTGNILSIKKYIEPLKIKNEVELSYEPTNNTISINAKGHKLYDVFKRIVDDSGKNLVFAPGMENEDLNVYLNNIPFDVAMNKMALANNLYVEKTKDNFYVFEKRINSSDGSESQVSQRPIRRQTGNLFFKVLDKDKKLLEVDFVNEPIANIISELSKELKINIFTATPLDKAGLTTFKAKSVSFDELLIKIFEIHKVSIKSVENNSTNQRNQNPSNASNSANFSFKKEGNIYYFGTEDQLSIRKVEMVSLQHRSVSLLNDPKNSRSNTNASSNNNFGNNSFNNYSSGSANYNNGNRTRDPVRTNDSSDNNSTSTNGDLLDLILPEELKEGLDIKVDYELNSFYVTGPSANVERFKKFIKEIDKSVPVVLIEVMIIEVTKSATIEAGVEWGIGDAPTTTQGNLFPETNIAFGATTINKIIGSFNDFAGFNLGRVGPNFFANIRALETNGDLKVKSTPRLATLNGHRAIFSNSQTSFYAVTQRDIFGTDNPQTSEITNYYPIDAELSLIIKPSVTGNGKVILDIGVIQSSFGSRVAEGAPPDINARSFNSIIAMQDQDIAILGGIEEQFKNNSGSGVPFLAKIPLIKWLFSKRVREARKSKLTVLIKPTIIY